MGGDKAGKWIPSKMTLYFFGEMDKKKPLRSRGYKPDTSYIEAEREPQ
jgi:hypothetical protein